MPSPIPDFIYLASQSPRRSQLLDQLGVRHALLLPDADEDSEALEVVLRNEAPKTYVQRVTALKLQAAQQRLVRRNHSGHGANDFWQTAGRRGRQTHVACVV